jgi:hypothetical protein
MVPDLAVDQRSRGEAYISFSQPNPNHSIDKEHLGKNSKNTRTARTGRTATAVQPIPTTT